MIHEERAAHCLVWNDKDGLREMMEMYVPKDVHARIRDEIAGAVAEEREACAKVCDAMRDKYAGTQVGNVVAVCEAAENIRSRP